jgi:hypothetical protein
MNILTAIFMLGSAFLSVSAQCSLPTSYKWMNSGVLSAPQQTGTSFEEFTHVPCKDKYLFHAS